MNKNIAGVIVLVCLIWGYLWVPIKIGLEYLPPFLFSAVRLIIGACVLIVLQLFLRKSIFPKKNEWMSLFILSLLMCVGYYGLSTFGMQFVDSGLSSVLVYTMPIMICVLAHFLVNERLTTNKVVGLIMGTIGLTMILWPQLINLKWDLQLIGQIFILFSAFFWASSSLYSKKVFSDYDKVKLTIWQMLIGGILLLFISIFSSESLPTNQWLTQDSILSILYSSVLGTAVAFLAWNWVLSKIEASIASISVMAVPLLGLFFGWLQLDEVITVNIIFGAVFVCLGILFTSIKLKFSVKQKEIYKDIV